MKESELKKFMRSPAAKAESERISPYLRGATQTLNNRVFRVLGWMEEQSDHAELGSGVVMRVKDRLFFVTAAHVLDEGSRRGTADLYIYGAGVFKLTGDMSVRIDDQFIDGKKVVIDAAVFELAGSIPDSIASNALNAPGLAPLNYRDMYIVAGYPNSHTQKSGNATIYGLTLVPSFLRGSRLIGDIPVDCEVGATVVEDVSLAFPYYGRTVENGLIETIPALDGISGGAIFCVEGLPVMPDVAVTEPITLTLAAIVVELQKRTSRDPPVLVGTNVQVHIAMINYLIARPDADRFKWAIEKVSRPYVPNEQEKMREGQLFSAELFAASNH